MKATLTFNMKVEVTPEATATLGYMNELFVGNEGTWVNGDMQARIAPPPGTISCLLQNEDESELVIIYTNGAHILLFNYEWYSV